MARGLTAKWKQVIYFDFDQKMTKEILYEAITLLNNIGFKTVACVSDMGGGNISLMNQLNINKENVTFYCPGIDQPVVYFPDAPHLLKLTRNWLIDYRFQLDDEIVSIEPIAELIKISDKTEIRAAHKLTDEHLPKKGSFSRQNVRKAAQLLFHTTAKCLRFFKKNGSLKSEHSESTANFVELADKWFNLVNVRHPDWGKYTPPHQKAYGSDIDAQDEILKEMQEAMKKIKILNIPTSAMQIFQKGVIHHANSMKALFENLYPEGLR